MKQDRISIVEKVFTWSKKKPYSIAVYTKEEKLTYSELFCLAYSCSTFLKKSGVEKGDLVVFRANQTINFPILYLGIHLAGAVVVALEKSIPDSKMIEIAKSLNARHIIIDSFGSISESGLFSSIYKNVIAFEKLSNFSILFPSLSDSADVLFTTGTTGLSKGVELSHLSLVATAENLIFGCEYKKDTMIIVPGPLNHANAVRKLFTSLYNGSSIYILSGFTDIAGFFSALSTKNVSISCCLPPAAIRTIFVMTNDKIGEYKNVIDFIESASAPLPEIDKIRLHNLLPNTRLYNNYGSSESASVCMFDYGKHLELVGCIGKPTLNAEILIVDDDRNVIKSSKTKLGYISSRGDMNMTRYINEPKLTEDVLKNGIVYTNDLGYIDNEGYVYIVGRKGDVINVGGLKVSPIEVESAALEFKGVEDCICVGIKDQITGRALKLLIVSKMDIDFLELNKSLSKKLENYKVPKLYERVEKIARTYNGKLDRKYYDE